MGTIRVLLIESTRNNDISFAVSLKRKYQVQIARSGKQGLAMALDTRPDVIVLDAASLRTSGKRICARLRANLGEMPIIHIHPTEATPGDSAADVVLFLPFTARKLINRIERFAARPESQVVGVGQFSLNLEQRTLTTPWSEKKLTPKLAALMAMFIRKPNQTLERKQIMQTVWKTDYMGDTRTLDVHIRWLRQVAEPNPLKPQYITTVRGVGYCFVIQEMGGKAAEVSRKPKAEKKINARSSKEKPKKASE